MWRKQDQGKPSSAATDPAVSEGRSEAVEAARPAAPASKPAQDALPDASRLTAALKIKGDISGSEDLFVDAQVDGRIQLDGATVTIGPSGRIAADVEAGDIVVQGNVQGSLLAAGRVRVGATGKTRGSILARHLSIEDGAEIHGPVETIQTEGSSAARPGATKTEDVSVPKPVPAATSLAKEPSAAA
jgi:cytoskeletal protein CcmA (bactofilin family)